MQRWLTADKQVPGYQEISSHLPRPPKGLIPTGLVASLPKFWSILITSYILFCLAALLPQSQSSPVSIPLFDRFHVPLCPALLPSRFARAEVLSLKERLLIHQVNLSTCLAGFNQRPTWLAKSESTCRKCQQKKIK